jgi:SNF2 family DNA or RNA helicase
LVSVDEKKANALMERLKPYYCRRFLRDVVTDLPEVFYKPIYIQLEGLQKQLYQSAVTDQLTALKEEKGVITYRDVVVKFPYVSSLLSDPCLLDGKLLNLYGLEKWKFEDSIKYKTLESLLSSIYEDDSKEKVVIWEEHPGTIERLGKALAKYNPILIHGSNTPKGPEKYKWRDEQIDRFRKDDSVKILIANPTTLGTGTNLQFVRHVVYFSRSCDFVNWDQSLSRAERIGMIGEVTYYILLVDNSIDIHTDIILNNKEVLDRLFLKQGLSTKDCKDIFAGVKV